MLCRTQHLALWMRLGMQPRRSSRCLPENVHAPFLHHGKQVWAILTPHHAPDILSDTQGSCRGCGEEGGGGRGGGVVGVVVGGGLVWGGTSNFFTLVISLWPKVTSAKSMQAKPRQQSMLRACTLPRMTSMHHDDKITKTSVDVPASASLVMSVYMHQY